MNHYYIRRPRNFANEYSLYTVEANSPEEQIARQLGCERITAQKVRTLCREELDRRRYNPAFAYNAPTAPIPFTESTLFLTYLTNKYMGK